MPQFPGPGVRFGGPPMGGGFHAGPWHPGWVGWFGWLMPILFLIVVAGLVIWTVSRLTQRPGVPAAASGWAPPHGRADTALEEARLRYARGDLSRADYLQVSGDLSAEGEPRDPVPPTTSDRGTSPV